MKSSTDITAAAREMTAMIQTGLRGAGSGLVATAAMTGVMYAGKWTGLLRQLPPKHITSRLNMFSGGRLAAKTPGGFTTRWTVAHGTYGVATAFPYIALRRVLPGPAFVIGPAYGVVLWAVSYFGVLPALGLFPSPSDDTKSRSAVMIAAHLVYGFVLALLVGPRRKHNRNQSPPNPLASAR